MNNVEAAVAHALHWRSYLYAHFLATVSVAACSLVDSSEVHAVHVTPALPFVLRLSLVGSVPFLYVAPFVDLYLVAKAIKVPGRYWKIAVADLFLSVSQVVFSLPLVQ